MIRDVDGGSVFAQRLEVYANSVFQWAVDKGFETSCPACRGEGDVPKPLSQDEYEPCEKCRGTGAGPRNFGEQVALVHGELGEVVAAMGDRLGDADKDDLICLHKKLGEVLETHRRHGPAGVPDEHCPDFSNVEIEVADVIIRLLCMSAAYGWRVGRAIDAKMAYNRTRPTKHGKAY
jgi:hypothetical protein